MVWFGGEEEKNERTVSQMKMADELRLLLLLLLVILPIIDSQLLEHQ